jgi:hypothetical protein
MVSNVLRIDQAELESTLQRIGRDYADDTEYQELRSALPDDWPF